MQDYRTMTTGIRPEQLESGESESEICGKRRAGLPCVVVAPCFALVRAQVAECIRGKIIIGHSLWQHLSVRADQYVQLAIQSTKLTILFAFPASVTMPPYDRHSRRRTLPALP